MLSWWLCTVGAPMDDLDLEPGCFLLRSWAILKELYPSVIYLPLFWNISSSTVFKLRLFALGFVVVLALNTMVG